MTTYVACDLDKVRPLVFKGLPICGSRPPGGKFG
jgi:hypothetical protein